MEEVAEASWPIRAFYRGLSKSTIAARKAAFERGAELPDDDPDSYKPAPGDAGAETKPSPYTKAYHKRYRKDLKESATDKALRRKSDESGFPYGVLKQVFNRGVAAWKAGHKPGTTPIQWGMARVNSFIVGGRTREVGDPDLWAQVKGKIKKKNMKNESNNEGGMARNDLKTIARSAREMHDLIESGDDLPEWVQAKITKAAEFLSDALDFMKSKEEGE
jgi:hypothetical protein